MKLQDTEIKNLMLAYKKIAVIGLSDAMEKPSFRIPDYIRSQGWEVVGTYPKPHSQGGFKIYPSLAEVPAEFRKFVNVFRASPKIPEIVEEVLTVGGVEFLWLQLGIEHPEAEAKAEVAGIKVVSNRCLLIEHKRLF
jgi:uncharacterized protein